MNEIELRMQYAGVVNLLAESSVHLGKGFEADEIRDLYDQAISDFCRLTGWSYKRILHRFELIPPNAED